MMKKIIALSVLGSVFISQCCIAGPFRNRRYNGNQCVQCTKQPRTPVRSCVVGTTAAVGTVVGTVTHGVEAMVENVGDRYTARVESRTENRIERSDRRINNCPNGMCPLK